MKKNFRREITQIFVHYALEYYTEKLFKKLNDNDLEDLITRDQAINYAIEKLKHQPEFYQKE